MNKHDLIELFGESVYEAGYLFVPEGTDSALAFNILRYIVDQGENESIIADLIKTYLITYPSQIVHLKDFANKLDKVLESIQENRESMARFKEIARQTRERLEGK
jgi:hypothetical protein